MFTRKLKVFLFEYPQERLVLPPGASYRGNGSAVVAARDVTAAATLLAIHNPAARLDQAKVTLLDLSSPSVVFEDDGIYESESKIVLT